MSISPLQVRLSLDKASIHNFEEYASPRNEELTSLRICGSLISL